MERLVLGTRLDFESLAPAGDFLALPQVLNHARPKENEVIAQGGNQGEAIGVRLGDKRQEKKRRVDPCDPFDLQRQDKEDVNNFVGIKMGKGKEESSEQ